MNRHAKKIVDELCDYLGYNFGSPMCKELHKHVEECDECQEYIESVKLTVKICQDCNESEPVPQDVKKMLLEKLKKKMHEAGPKND